MDNLNNSIGIDQDNLSSRPSTYVQKVQANSTNILNGNKQQSDENNKVVLKTLSYIKYLVFLICLLVIFILYNQLSSQFKIPQKQIISLKNTTQPKVQFQSNQNLKVKIQKQRDQPSYTFKHKHSNLTFQYPTVGIPIPGQLYNSTKVQQKDLAFFDQEVNQIFKPYNDTDCQYGRIGDRQDGGYVLCSNYIGNSEALINLGVQGRDQFGCQLTSKYTNMLNFQYDCTNPTAPQCLTNNNSNIFSLICLGEVSELTQRHTFYSLEDIIKTRGLKGKRITLKIDVEGGQYLGFKYLPTQYLDFIDQIVMELHFGFIASQQWGFLDIFRSLADKFVNVNYHNNNNGCFQRFKIENRKLKSFALEVSLVNKRLIKKHSNSTSFKEHPLNKINSDSFPDCKMDQ